MPQDFKTIDQPFVIETIDERFDNISTMLTDNALVYGSSITSIMSGLPADGDLDIAVSHMEFLTLCERFANSSKWKQISGDRIKETDFSNRHLEYRPTFKTSAISFRTRGGPVTPRPEFPGKKYSIGLKNPDNYRNISRTVTFETVGNKRVQIIQAKEKTNNPFNDAMSIVKAVDFIFCGIAIDKHGKTFEVIESAFDDCHNKVIHVANYHSRLTERFKKYTKRGWSLGISIDQANQNYLKEKKKEKKKEESLPSDDKYIRMEYDKKTGPKFIFLSSMFKKLKPEELHSLITLISKQIYGVDLKQITSGGPLIYTENGSIRGYHLSKSVAIQMRTKIIHTVKERLTSKKKKKFYTMGDYGEMTKFVKKQLHEFVRLSNNDDSHYTTGTKLHGLIDNISTNISPGQHVVNGTTSDGIKTILSEVEPDEEVDMPDEAEGPMDNEVEESEEPPMYEQSNMFAKQIQNSTIKHKAPPIIDKIIDDVPDKYKKLSVTYDRKMPLEYGEWKSLEDEVSSPYAPTAGAEWFSGLKKEKKVKEDVVDTIIKIIDSTTNK
jgi:hypothetical protein